MDDIDKEYLESENLRDSDHVLSLLDRLPGVIEVADDTILEESPA